MTTQMTNAKMTTGFVQGKFYKWENLLLFKCVKVTPKTVTFKSGMANGRMTYEECLDYDEFDRKTTTKRCKNGSIELNPNDFNGMLFNMGYRSDLQVLLLLMLKMLTRLTLMML